MRFKVDENLHEDVAALFTECGHDVQTVYTEGLRGSDDAVLAEHCRREGRAVVTLDLDFGDIRSYPPTDYDGIIVIRTSSQSRSHVLSIMTRLMGLLDQEPLAGRLWIVSDSDVRIRGE